MGVHGGIHDGPRLSAAMSREQRTGPNFTYRNMSEIYSLGKFSKPAGRPPLLCDQKSCRIWRETIYSRLVTLVTSEASFASNIPACTWSVHMQCATERHALGARLGAQADSGLNPLTPPVMYPDQSTCTCRIRHQAPSDASFGSSHRRAACPKVINTGAATCP